MRLSLFALPLGHPDGPPDWGALTNRSGTSCLDTLLSLEQKAVAGGCSFAAGLSTAVEGLCVMVMLCDRESSVWLVGCEGWVTRERRRLVGQGHQHHNHHPPQRTLWMQRSPVALWSKCTSMKDLHSHTIALQHQFLQNHLLPNRLRTPWSTSCHYQYPAEGHQSPALRRGSPSLGQCS